MKRNYLPVTVVVIVLGVGLSLIPQTLELSQPYEMETLYNQTETTKASVDGEVQEFMFRTGRVDTVDGFSPTLILTNSADENINATVVNLDHPSTINAFVNESHSVIVYQVEEADSYDLKITGWVRADMQVEVTATFIYYSHTPPERYTYYPYMYFGLGMASVGIVTSVIAAYYNEKAARLPE